MVVCWFNLQITRCAEQSEDKTEKARAAVQAGESTANRGLQESD